MTVRLDKKEGLVSTLNHHRSPVLLRNASHRASSI
jgi:hypothetical protein